MKINPNDPINLFGFKETMANGEFGLQFKGLTKREWFLGMALQGMIAAQKGRPHEHMDDIDCARRVIQHVDALLSEINKERP